MSGKPKGARREPLSWRRALTRAAIGGLVAVCLVHLNVLNAKKAEEASFYDTAERLGQQADIGGRSAAQKLVRVVYVDDTTFPNAGPSDLGAQASMLQMMAGDGAPQKPIAIFADYGFRTSRQGFEQLETTLKEVTKQADWINRGGPACIKPDPVVRIACIVNAGGVPVISGQPSGPEAEADKTKTLLDVLVVADLNVSAPEYNLRRKEGAAYGITPVAALFTAYCFDGFKRRPAPAACNTVGLSAIYKDVADRQDDDQLIAYANAWLPGRSPPMLLSWSSNEIDGAKLPIQAVSGGVTCEDPGGFFSAVAAGVTRAMLARVDNACSATFDFPYKGFTTGALDSSHIKTLLDRKLILLGNHFEHEDLFPSPVQGQVYGVNYHAAALQTLIWLGPTAYPRVPAPGYVLVWTFLLVTALLFIDHWLRTRLQGRSEAALKGRLGALGVSVLTTAAFATVAVFVLHWHPLFAIAAVAIWLSTGVWSVRESVSGFIESLENHIAEFFVTPAPAPTEAARHKPRKART